MLILAVNIFVVYSSVLYQERVYYDRFTLPSVMQAGESGLIDGVGCVLGYPNAGTPIAEAFVRLAYDHLDKDLRQLKQDKVTHTDGKRELGSITSEYEKDEITLAVGDTATGGDTKIEGWHKIVEHELVYAGLVLIVERDPLGSALVGQQTEAPVRPSMHWLSLVERTAKRLDLPRQTVQQELDYTMRLFEWNVDNNNLDNLPDPNLIA